MDNQPSFFDTALLCTHCGRFSSFLRLPEGEDGYMNKPGSLPDLTNFHVNCGGNADASPPMVGGGGGGGGQYKYSHVGMEGDDNMGSPYSSVSRKRAGTLAQVWVVASRA